MNDDVMNDEAMVKSSWKRLSVATIRALELLSQNLANLLRQTNCHCLVLRTTELL
jgi:hypothetical protein